MGNGVSSVAVTERNTAVQEKTSKTVLIVDDDRVLATSLAEGLSFMAEELTVYIADNGMHATDIIKSTPVDLLLTDLRMPDMDGLELVLWMNEYRPKTPVLVMSAYSDISTMLNLQTQGNYFFDKPLDFGALLVAIRSLLA